ncbi:hypothetical protein Cni_G25133 [Canna indica]|uniref:NAC domain-containing protein n=1 Tax=Canna indica TaxID=4628 RepID=A0AAQ3L1C8_9LILI|nr:hypothetical protein Cni_G25133 [Canna indica]
MSSPAPLPPGFRFHPTDEELILHYLRNQAAALPCPVSIIAEVDIYKFDPWDLPAKAMFGEQEWYFFTPRDRKYPNGVRPNRAAASGYWKATGTDKPIQASRGSGNIGVKKALVFYKGRPPKGRKTNWIMHEYRLAEAQANFNYKPMKFGNFSMRLDDWVLCRIYKKNNKLEPVPPLVDHEQEPSLQNVEQGSGLKLQKSFSIPDFLEDYSTVHQLLDNLPEWHQGLELGLMGQPTISQLLVETKHEEPQEEYPASVAANSAKVFAEFNDQLNGTPCNLLNQSFFNQQLMLNSHLAWH